MGFQLTKGDDKKDCVAVRLNGTSLDKGVTVKVRFSVNYSQSILILILATSGDMASAAT